MTFKSIVDFSDDELTKEIERRKQDARIKAQYNRDMVNASVVANVSGLIAVSRHTKTNCTDFDPINAYDGCTRCTLCNIQEAKFMNNDCELEITIWNRPIT